MITTALIGGLGNQLFKIFTAIAYAIKYEHSFLFPYSKKLIAGSERSTYWDDFLKKLRNHTTANPEYKLTNDYFNDFIRIYNLDHHYVELPIPEKDKKYMITGYCQSYKYFDEFKQPIFQMIDLEKQVECIKEDYSNYFSHKKNTHIIGMHFRIGDYKYLQHSHNILKSEYYERALTYIINKHQLPTSSPKIITSNVQPIQKQSKKEIEMQNNNLDNEYIRVLYFVEKDDVYMANFVIDHLKSLYPYIEFIMIDTNIPDWKQMLIMSCCHSIIIANSTFSWWAAYFNKNPDIICYPDRWFGPRLIHNNINDMFPPTWIKIHAD